jgi:hypothetical protein
MEAPESAKARAAYAAYEAMGPDRSLAKLAQTYGKSTSYKRQLERWSSQFHWPARVAEYEQLQLAQRRRKREHELEVMNDEHAIYGRTQALRAIQQIERLIREQKFGSQAAVQLLKVATDLERMSRGASTARV